MQFSRFGDFLSSGSGIVQLMEDLGSAVHAEHPIYMLGGGNPGAIPEVQQYFRGAMANLIRSDQSFDDITGRYDSPDGDAGFRQTMASFLNEQFEWHLGPDNIAVTNGSQSSFFTLFNLFAGEFADGKNRKILLPVTPEYIGYSDVGLGNDLFVSIQPTIELLDDHLFKYHLDLEQLSVDDSIGAVCVSRPTNPTGNVLTDEEIAVIHEQCQTADVPFIIDGAYGTPFPNIIFTEARPVWDHNIILCLSLSKIGLPGVRTGIVVASEPVIEAISASNAIMSLAPGSIGPSLIQPALQNGDVTRISNQLVKPFYRNKAWQAVDWLRQQLHGLPFRIHQPEGAIFLWLWLEGLPVTSIELYERLKHRGVLVIAGEHFFPGLQDDGSWRHRYECLRISYAGDERTVFEGIRIIADEVRQAYSSSD